MSINIYEHHNTSEWSGGSTTEIFISPENGHYATLDFELRISLAKVEVKKSIFTPLIGVERKLMVLDGQINLSHKNQHNSELKKFDVDSFNGSWNTTCAGNSTNFNIMSKGPLKTSLYGVKMNPTDKISIGFEEKWRTVFIYVIQGSLEIEIKQKKIAVECDCLLKIDRLNQSLLNVYSKNGCEIAVTKTSLGLT